MKYSLNDLRYLMQRLRDKKTGCPWDIKQDFRSITASTIEEAYEVVDAIEHGNKEDIKEELGDLLFQIIFYNQLAEEEQLFNFDDIIHTLTEKLISRHPHVFPEGKLTETFTQALSEEEIKEGWTGGDIKLALGSIEGEKQDLGDYSEKRYGFNVGLPLIKDKLFFIF